MFTKPQLLPMHCFQHAKPGLFNIVKCLLSIQTAPMSFKAPANRL
jgi:hypothetical protein